MLLHEYWRWTGDAALVRKLEEAARRAIAWIEGPADRDGDGYLEYKTRSPSPTRLDNQCWKDSDGSIVFADGSLAEPPIAACEVQGYAYDARLRTAELAEEVWGDAALAKRLRNDADALKERFNRDFWSSRRRHYVLALDSDKRQVDALTSNIGHLLWSGIVDDERAGAMVKQLMGGELFTGWGVRCLATSNPAYNPLDVPQRHGLATRHVDRRGGDAPVRVQGGGVGSRMGADGGRDALRVQRFRRSSRASSATRRASPCPIQMRSFRRRGRRRAPLLGLRTILGLDPVGGKLRSKPVIPDEISGKRIRLRGVHVHGKRFDAPQTTRLGSV